MINQNFWFSFGYWQTICYYYFHDPDHITQKRVLIIWLYDHCRLVWWCSNRQREWAIRMEDQMLWTIAVSLIILWVLGLVTGYTVGYFIHIPLFFAIIAMLIQVEDDCSDYGSGHTRKRYLERRVVSRSRKILPKLAILSGEKVSQPIISPQTYREE